MIIPSIPTFNDLSFAKSAGIGVLSDIPAPPAPPIPQPGYVFVYDHIEQQVYDHLLRSVEVSEDLANT